ncbi:TonB-dependent Receptor Plug Domain [Sphingomonas guangdongensis]|uniref:TonB-dependent Receptor Plug Domain n=1 Tax=Sphingomonas guangdongensis TaxID=1141890 RepID=A0A285QY93_9SPHN|nr:TonB-dependent receptor [Sphingomonas guangdongensis]SOB86930.1 TonB-dependent Receptor Plug Domain [Sphingomonas guangdongensis]
MSHAVRFRRALYLGSAIAWLGAMPAVAQDVPPPTPPESDGEIVVTGTRLARDPNEVAPSPISTITAADIRLTGQIDATEALREIPALSNSGTISDSIERGAGGIGQATLDLRGMGANRTLVVVNGRRHVSGVAGSQIVDVATIPNALIERVDVLSGGASAVYGADAVTGVVNYVLKRKFEGLDLNLQQGISGEGDGRTFSADLVAGANFADGRGNLTFAFGYANQQEILFGDRDYTRDNGRFNTGQTYPSPDRRFQTGDISAAATPNFFARYSTASGRYPIGFAIPTAAQFATFFPGRTPTAAEQALIDRATNAPSLAFSAFPAFAISSSSGLIARNDYEQFTADVNRNGVPDCQESYIGATTVPNFYGGCYVSNPDGTVRIFRDGIIASGSNQFGGDGAPERTSQASLIPGNQRFNVNLLGSFEVSSAVEAFFEAKYVRSETTSRNNYNTFYDSLFIAPDNPYIPAQLAADAAAGGGLRVSRDFLDLGPGITTADRDTYRGVAGLRGDLSPHLRYEVSGTYGRTDSAVTFSNSVLYDRLFASIDAVRLPNGTIGCRSDVDPTPYVGSEFFSFIEGGFFTFRPGDGSCRPASLFNGVNSVSQEAVDFITTPTTTRASLRQYVASASLVGDTGGFFSLPGGAPQFAIGAEYRKEESRTRFDPLALGTIPDSAPAGLAGQFIGDLSSNQSLVFDAQTRTFNSGGEFDVYEVYGELRLPILSDRPFFETLELSGAGRFSHYSTVGDTFTWNVNGIYAPIPDIRVRGTYARAIRAPNIAELFDPTQGTVFRPADPCDAAQIAALTTSDAAAGARRQANCVADGLPVGFNDPLTARFSGTTGGNPDLSEETATTWTAGLVLAPRFLPGLTISGDYYDISIENAISAVSAQDIVDSCYDSASLDNIYCDLFERNRTQGSPTFLGLSFLRQQQLNFGRIETAGVDANISYSFALGDNQIQLRGSGNWVRRLNFFFNPSDPSFIDPELREQGRPEWSATGSVSWRNGPVGIGYRLQYIDSQYLAGVEAETADVVAGPAGLAGAKYVHDVSFTIDASDRFTLYGGLNNLTNVKPYPTNSAYPVSPYGRSFFIGLNIKTGRLF